MFTLRTKERIMQIWAEAFTVTGTHNASFLGENDALTLRAACKQCAEESNTFARYFDSFTMTYWGCKLFSTEEEALAYKK